MVVSFCCCCFTNVVFRRGREGICGENIRGGSGVHVFFFFFMWLKYIFRMFSACLHVGSVAVDCFDLLLEVLFYVSMVSSVLCSLE